MGNEDLVCSTDEELRHSVAKIKEGYDVYQKLKHLQLEFIDSHDELAPGVFRTSYANGEKVYVNYNAATVVVDNVTVPAMDYDIVNIGG